MKKVILNKSFGGFDVSDEGYRLYAKKKGLELFTYKLNLSKDFGFGEYQKVDSSDSIFVLYTTKDLGDVYTSDDVIKNRLYLNEELREDETLIEVVEELGEKASGKFGKLIIVEIPDDVAEDYVIDYYDGIETLHQRVEEW